MHIVKSSMPSTANPNRFGEKKPIDYTRHFERVIKPLTTGDTFTAHDMQDSLLTKLNHHTPSLKTCAAYLKQHASFKPVKVKNPLQGYLFIKVNKP
jgi:hypothetical protein